MILIVIYEVTTIRKFTLMLEAHMKHEGDAPVGITKVTQVYIIQARARTLRKSIRDIHSSLL